MEPITDSELSRMLCLATDGADHEWGWYEADVPRLIDELEQTRWERDEARAEAAHWANR